MSLVTTVEAAEMLDVSRQRVDQMLRDGILTGRQVNSRMWLVELKSVHDRNRAGRLAGRPWQSETVWTAALALTNRCSVKADIANRILRNDIETLAGRIAQQVQVRRYAAKSTRDVAGNLALTGESAINRLGTDIIGSSATVHGYARGDIGDVIDELGLVENEDGNVALYSFSGGNERFQGMEHAPEALIAIDCIRSTTTRVRSAGLNALERMTEQWLASTTK